MSSLRGCLWANVHYQLWLMGVQWEVGEGTGSGCSTQCHPSAVALGGAFIRVSGCARWSKCSAYLTETRGIYISLVLVSEVNSSCNGNSVFTAAPKKVHSIMYCLVNKRMGFWYCMKRRKREKRWEMSLDGHWYVFIHHDLIHCSFLEPRAMNNILSNINVKYGFCSNSNLRK